MNKAFKLDKTNIEDIVDLTSLQEGILFHYLKDGSKNLYFVQLSLEIQGTVNFDYFQKAWNKVVANNEMLRTIYRWEKLNKPVQIILKEKKVDIRYYDLSKEENILESEYQKIKLKDSDESFDLREVPFRLTLCKFNTDKYSLLISNHHIIYDGWSNGIILKEFLNYYNELVTGSTLKVNKKALFKNYIKFNQEPSTEDESFWKDYQKGFEPKNVFSFRNTGSLSDNSNNQSHKFSISPDKFSILKQICKSQKLTIADILYGAWGILLSKYSGESDILFGTTISGRNIKFEGIEQIVGLFINTIPIRIRITPDKPLISVLKENAKQTLERGRFENVPLRTILDYSGYKESELIESIFVVENYPLDKENLQQQDELVFKSFTIKETTNYKLTVSALISDEIEISFNYINAYFEKELIKNIEKHYVRIIDRIINDNKSAIQSLDLLSDIEKHQLLHEFNKTKRDYPENKTIHHLLEEQATKIPDTKALIFGHEQLSYEELNKRSGQLASYLASNGIVSGDKVGLIVDRSLEMLIGIFGILKAGGVYVPIDPTFPENRIKYILDSSESKLVLSERIYKHIIEYSIPFIFFEDIDFSNTSVSEYIPKIVPDDLSYIIYTSGSTGTPKGVQVEHRSVINLLYFLQDQYPISIEDSYLLKTSYCFDVSISEIFGWILGGGKLSILEKGKEKDPSKIIDAILRNKITHINFVPTALKSFSQSLSVIDQTRLKSLKFLLIAGEALYQDHLQEFNKLNLNIYLANIYGPTEATVYTSYYKVIPGILETVPIGKPISNYSIFILDNRNKLQPFGMPGELCIGGVGLARGYMGNPTLTSEKFIDHPFQEGERLYRTGDLARWLPDGNIEFLGRIDDQVKIRGFRIELGEIENVLQKHEDIKECVVLAIEEKEDKYLCAYIISEENFNKEEIRTYLSVSLPDYMIPSYFVELERIPLTSNGKLDRKSLPTPEIKAGSAYVAPKNLIETKLVKIWSEVLNVASKEISTNESFFEFGGHSLKATVLVSRIHKELDVQLELREVFKFPTIQTQAELINSSENTSYFLIPKANTQEYYALSSSQRRLYLLQQMDLGSTAYNMPGLVAVPKGQNKHQIKEVFKKLIARHENFRTSFEVEKDIPVQRIHSEVSFSIKEYQIISAELFKVREDFVQAFDLSDAPLLRVGYLEISDGDDMLLIDMHHIISDGRSLAILEEDFSKLLAGKELESLHLQYKDYSEWQNSKEQQERIKVQETYWLNKFAGELPILELPTDYSRPTLQSFEGASFGFMLSVEETKTVHDLCKEQGLTLYMSLISIFAILLSKLSGQEDIIVGSPIAARRHADLEDIVGMFVNTLAIRSNISGDKRLIDYLQELKENILEAYENQEYQFEDLIDKVVENRDASRNPIFDVMFNLMEGVSYQSKDLKEVELNHEKGISKFDLSLTALDSGSEIELSFEYSTKLLKPKTIERFVNYFRQLIQSLSGNLQQKLNDLNILSEEERQQLLYEFNETKIDYPKDKTIIQLFEDQVKQTPENIALVSQNESLTYSELNKKSNELAHYLIKKGAVEQSFIAVVNDSSVETYVGILGILRIGKAYLPIDSTLPDSRIQFMLEDCGVKTILSSNDENSFINNSNKQFDIVNVKVIKKTNSSDLNLSVHSLSPVYVIYTSGSTGKPKGVVVEHKSLVNLCLGHNEFYGVDSKDRSCKYAGFGFDASVWEFFPVIIAGASLYLIDENIKLDPEKVNNYFEENKITISFLPTQFCEKFMEYDNKSLRILLTGGDKLNRFTKRDYKLFNNYGPTENTVVTTRFEVKKHENNIPIGKPIENSQVYILGKNNQLQPIGVLGELCIGGIGLCQGYLNNENLTKEKFIDHPFIEGERIYKSGDLARWLPDGNIEFSGRIDQQVKIRGFRIELGEIENVLLRHKSIIESVVLAWGQGEDKYLCAYIVVKEEFNRDNIRNYLSLHLPDYMIPSYFVELEKILLTNNGKIDKKSLLIPEIKAGSAYEAPKNLIESKLVNIWSQVLKVASKEISTNVSFFELGGHSLKATVLASHIHKELDVRLELREVFQYQTIQAQAELINSSESSTYFSITKAMIQEYYPLSSSQRRLYLLQQMDLESTAYNMPSLLAVPKAYNKNQITNVFNKLISRHENFRTSFEVKNEIPVQCIHTEVSFSIKEYQITKAELIKVRKDLVQAFDLCTAPLLRVAYLKISDGEDMLLVDMHHIISDGRSHVILEEDFSQLLAGNELEPLRLQYKDYSEWQNSKEQQERIKEQEIYWLNKFMGELPVLKLPTDYTRPVIQIYDGANVGFVLSAEETKIIHDLCKDQGLTLYMSVLSIFTILLSKLSGQEDIIVGSPIAARRHSDLEDIVGMFVNTLAIRSDVSGDKRLIDYLQELKENTLEAFENQEYQFEDLVENVSLERDISRNPLFDVMFNLLNHTEYSKELLEFDSEVYVHTPRISKFDMTLTAVDYGDQVLIDLTYCTKLFRPKNIERFIEYFKKIINQLPDKLEEKLFALDIVVDEEKKQLLFEFNDNKINYPEDKSIHQLFEEQVERTPNNVAIVFEDNQISYKELNERANRLAYYLKNIEVRSNSVVSLFFEPSIEMLISIIGVLKTGAAFLPINTDLPTQRVNYILNDSGSNLVLKNSNVNMDDPTVTKLVDVDNILLKEDKNEIQDINCDFNSAYIIYTSGTTGKPKGVAISHQNISNYIHWFENTISLIENDRAVLTTNFMFDAIYTLLFGALFNGARLSVIKRNVYLDPSTLIEYIDKENITLLKMTPTLFNALINSDMCKGANLKTVRYLMLGGEKINTLDVDKFYKHHDDLNIMNHYGPTETTVGSIATFIEVNKLSSYIKQPYIGKPIDNTDIYILNEYSQVQPIRVLGELCIGGEGLAIGYINSPELTAEKFIDHPFKEGQRLYRTGDLARWLPDGNIEFLGRIDHQVKIRGLRIELDEIENVLLKHESIDECHVMLREENQEKFLCAYIIGKAEINHTELRNFLIKFLPEYMVPSYFVQLEKLPLTGNGKVNPKVLPSPEIKAGNDYAAPSTETEEKLVEIWSEVLNIPCKEISVMANFFALGGHSLKATLLIGKIYKTTGVKLPLREIFIKSSIREQAFYINSSINKKFIEILPVQQKDYYEASSLQKRIYIQQKLNPETISYNMLSVLILEGNLDLQRVNNAFVKIVKRHEVFRTHFKLIDKKVMQIIDDEVDVNSSYVVSCENEWEQEIENFIKLFDLEKAPLLRYKLLKIAEEKHVLLVDMHHIIADGVSTQILIKEFTKFYNDENLSELSIQYRDFAEWHNKLKTSDEYGKERNFWLKKFQNKIPMNEVPADFIRPQIRSIDSGGSMDFELSENIVSKIDSMVKSLDGTIYMFLLTIFKILLAKFSGNEDVVVGTLVSGRIHPSLNNNVGMFVNTLALRNTISGNLSFKEIFENIKKNTIESFDNQMFQIEDLIQELGLQRDTGRNPLFNYLFNMNNMDKEDFDISDIKINKYTKSENQFSKFDLQLVAVRMDNAINLKLRYYNKLFKKSTIEKYTILYNDIIDQVLSNKDILINDIITTNNLTKITSTIETESEFNFEFD